MTQEIKILRVDETLTQSIVRGTFTLATVAFMVYISKDSTFWTFITGSLFIMFLWIWIDSVAKKTKEFTSTDQVRAWLDRIDAEKESGQ